jgi:hypothetical protein
VELAKEILSVSGVLFGFFFTGFWWALNRELEFEPEQRHFKFGYVLLIIIMGLLAYFGIIKPLEMLTDAEPNLIWSYRGILLTLVGVFGYMITELGHYEIFQRPKYATTIEKIAFSVTILAIIVLVIVWLT